MNDQTGTKAQGRLKHERGAESGIRLSVFGVVVALVFGLLLWARFVIITGHPRTAIAEPEVQAEAASVIDGRQAVVETPGGE